jgi:transcriptional regulator with XRE-family HTH domain
MGDMKEPDLRRFGELVARRRRELDITQDELARRVGWSQERISTIERGRYGLPSLPSLSRLATALETPLSDLLSAAGYPPAPALTDDVSRSNAPVLLYALERLLEVDGTDMRTVFNRTCTILGEALGAEKVDIFVLERTAETLVTVGTSLTPMGRRQHELDLDRLPLANGGTTVEAFKSGQPYETGQADKDPHVLQRLTDGLGIRSMMDLPIMMEGEVQGVLVVSSSSPDRFTPEDRRFAEAASRWTALMMHRAQLAAQLAAAER